MQLGGSIKRRRGSGRRKEGDPERSGALRLAGMVALLVVAGFGVGWAVATRVLFPAPPPPGDLFEVPDVRGVDRNRAAELLDEAGLSLGTIDGLRHPEADSGVVVGQAPLPGQLASPNAPVRVTLSLGPERREVPDVARLRGDWARNVLEATGFTVSVDSVDDALPRGRVVEIDPGPGTELSLPGGIHLVVSRGPPMVEMPDLAGMSEAGARDTLSALGIVVGSVEEVFRFGRDQGIVVEQSPTAGASVERGSAARLTVGRRSGGGGRGEGAAGVRTGGTKSPPDRSNSGGFRGIERSTRGGTEP